MKIATTQLFSQHAASLQANGYLVLDVTVKSGDKVFAPTWKMVKGYLNSSMTEEEYTNLYHGMMRDSFVKNSARWKQICQYEKVALACYCKPGDFCHRHLLKQYVAAAAKKFHNSKDKMFLSSIPPSS